MTKVPNPQPKFDLEERTLEFSKGVIRLCRALPKNTINFRLIDQLIRSAGSMGANYREASDALGKKDFCHSLKIARKETKETIYWLELVIEANPELGPRMHNFVSEATELKKIFSSIITKSKGV